MDRPTHLSRLGFAAVLIPLGVLGVLFRDFGLTWGQLPGGGAGGPTLAIIAGIASLLIGAALLSRRATGPASVALTLYAALWWLLLKVPPVLQAPGVEVNWLTCGQYAMLLAGAATLAAATHPSHRLGGERTRTWLRRGMGLAIIPVGLSHFVYLADATTFVPAWLPYREGWAWITGAFHIAAGVALLIGVVPRLAALLETAMLAGFALLVWVPAVFATPDVPAKWTSLWVTWALTVAVAVVALYTPARPRPVAEG